MATVPISLVIAGDTVTAVAMVSLVRSDTGLDAGIALPIALALTGGAWVGSFSDASPPPYYNAVASIMFGDGTSENTATFALQSGTTTTGVYGDITDIQAEMGEFNTAQAADPDNGGNAGLIAIHEQKAIGFADSFINSFLAKLGFVTPATVNLALLKIIFGKLGAYQLYQVRGLQDKNNQFQAKLDWAVAQLKELAFMNRGGFAYVSGISTGIEAVPQTVNPDGSPYSSTPPYPVLRWDGYLWTWG